MARLLESSEEEPDGKRFRVLNECFKNKLVMLFFGGT